MPDLKNTSLESYLFAIERAAADAQDRVASVARSCKEQMAETARALEHAPNVIIDALYQKAPILLSKELYRPWGQYERTDTPPAELRAVRMEWGDGTYDNFLDMSSQRSLPTLPPGKYRAFFVVIPIEDTP